MRARDLAVPFPTITADAPVLEAARLLWPGNLPGLIVVDAAGCPVTVLPGTQVLRMVDPRLLPGRPPLARMIDEPSADVFLRGLRAGRWPTCCPRAPELAGGRAAGHRRWRSRR